MCHNEIVHGIKTHIPHLFLRSRNPASVIPSLLVASSFH
jgi:hypothetical protein